MWLVWAALLCTSVQGVEFPETAELIAIESAPQSRILNVLDTPGGIVTANGPARRDEPAAASQRATACGVSRSANRIAGGGDAAVGQFSWLAGLTPRFGDFVYCSATVISEFFVLTAAHCVRIFHAEDLDILVNKHTREEDPNEVRLQVLEIIRHPNYLPATSTNDIALLRVSSMQALFDDPAVSVAPICLPDNTCVVPDQASCLVGKTATIAGWGFLQSDNPSLPTVVQQGQVPIIDNRNCQRRYYQFQTFVPIQPSMLCAGEEFGGVDACQGDSGGPLMVPRGDGSFALHGLVSFGRGCGQSGYPGVYTRVSAFRDWILSNV